MSVTNPPRLSAACLVAVFVLLMGSGPGEAPAATLAEELAEQAAQSASMLPQPLRAQFDAGIQDTRDSGVLKAALRVGDKAPDAELVSPDGRTVRLSAQWREGPVVVVFYRGGWCPYCNLQLRAMQRSLGEVEGAHARLVAVGPELPESVAKTVADNGLTFTVLSDRGNGLARKFGVVFRLHEPLRAFYDQRLGLTERNGDDSFELPLAATYVIDRTGVIRYAFFDADYKKRAEPADVLAAVRSLAP